MGSSWNRVADASRSASCQLLEHREDEGFVYDVTLGTQRYSLTI